MQTRLSRSLAATLLATMGCAGGLGGIGADEPQSKSPARGNPFKDVAFFLNPEFTASVEATAKRHPEEAALLRKAAEYPTGVWLSDIKSVANLKGWLDEAKAQQDRSGKPTMSVIVVYDLPDRDCAAESSAGELKTAENGEARYRTEFIDPITAQLKAHPDQPIAIVLEPDSLGNMATNMDLPKCQGARSAYKNGIVYAIKSFHLPNVSVYIDAAHGGWLGWDGNRAKIAKIYKTVLNDAGGPSMIRGFATNISNYTHLTNRDGAALEPSNPCPNELTYVKLLRETMAMYGFRDHGFLVDTSRNGKGKIRSAWGNWCNIKGAGLGERPRADPVPGVDAYWWVKPPGESDGSSDPNGPRFDPMCAGKDAAKDAPQAGQWFESYFIDLVRNANPPL
jgi:cellulose 1,4-beta-cellobiosidase